MGRKKLPKLACDVCGRDLAQAIDLGWVRWWAEPDSPESTIRRFEVVCRGRCEQQREAEGRLLLPRLMQLDGHLDWFTGKWALPQLWRLFREHGWTQEARERAAAFFELASELPDGKGPPILG